MSDLPTVVTKSGLQPQSPASLRDQLTAIVSATDPGYTNNLPGTLIEDIASTDVAAISLSDQARVELVNSLTPYGANEFLLNQLGQIYIGQGPSGASNTSVNVVFSTSPIAPGFVISKGFLVSDGSFQYTIQDGGVIEADGMSGNLSALATVAGSWAVPIGTVNQLVTSVPAVINLSVTNPLAGTPGLAAENWDAFRTQVLQAGLAASQGMARYLKTLLGKVPGVQSRLVSARQVPSVGWEIIVGGGDQYAVANAIFDALFDVNTLVGSTMNVTGITKANPGVVTTGLNHGLASAAVINISGVVGMVEVNDTPLTITVITEKTFSIGVDTTGYGTWISGGVVTPNPRNVVVSINDYPDTYNIPFVLPPQQTIEVVATWNTTSPNFVAGGAIAQLATPALIEYINTIPVGQPVILYELESVFQKAVADVLPPYLLTRLVFAVSINGIGVSPEAGTGIIAGDPESYLFATAASVFVAQG